MAASMLLLAPGVAATLKPAPKRPYAAISLTAPGSLGSFTPAAADPRRAALFARAGVGATDFSTFRFTPSTGPGNRRAVTVAVRSRASTKAGAERVASATVSGVAPTAYNLGVSVGWKRFALSGDILKVSGGLMPGDRESADVGVAYLGNKWSTRLQVAADRSTGAQSRLVGADESYSLDLGGSYALTRNIEVTGGLRYKLQHDRLQPIVDDRRDSQAVYIGTAFRF